MIRVGLIGYGLSGQVFHAPYLATIPGLQLSAIATRQVDAAKRNHPDVFVGTPEQIIASADLDLVVVAAPNAAHAPLATAALRAGKAVVVDKPVAVSLDEGRRLADEAKRCGRPLFPFHNRRWDDDFLTLKALLDDDVIGDLLVFESRFDRFRPDVADRWRERPAPGAGLWWDIGPHLIDQAVYLLGRPDAVTADLARQRAGATVTDYVHVVLHYQSRRAILRAGCLVSSRSPRLTAEGTKGAFTTWDFDSQEGRLRSPGVAPQTERVGQLSLARPDGIERREILLTSGTYSAFYQGVRDALQTGADPPVALGEALVGLEVLEAAELSAAQARTVHLN